MTTRLLLAVSMAAVAAGGPFGAVATSAPLTPEWSQGGVPPPPAPSRDALARLKTTDIDGQQWTVDDMRGRVVLIDFWATWCAPCLAELPRLKALRARHSREDFEILGVSLDVTSRQSFVSWLNRQRIDWPQVHERAGYADDVPRLFGVDRLPRTILVGREGNIAAVDLRGERLAARVDALVAAGAVPPVQEVAK